MASKGSNKSLPEGISLRLLPSGEPRWDVEYYIDGERKQETCYTEDDALNRHAEIKTDKRRGTYVDMSGGRMTLRKYVEEMWLPSKTIAPSTRTRLDSRLKLHILPTFGKTPLIKIRATAVKTWQKNLTGAESTNAKTYTALADILNCAVEDRLIPTNPAKEGSVVRARPRSSIRVVKEVWTADQVEDIRCALDRRWSVAVPMGARIGLRQGEALGLSPDDVDFLGRKGVVRVRRQVKQVKGRMYFGLPKYEKTREVPLADGARDALAAYLAEFPAREVTLPWEEDPDPEAPNPGRRRAGGPQRGEPVTVRLIMTTVTGKAMGGQRFNKEIWRPALGAAGIPWVSHQTGTHALRHYYASVAFAGGYSEIDVAQFLGHNDSSFTSRTYGHFMQRPDEAIVRRRVEELNRPRKPAIRRPPANG